MQEGNRTDSPDGTGRWASRPVLSLLIRAFVLLSPMVASFLVAIFVGRAVPPPSGGGSTVLWWGAVLPASFTALYVVQRLVRRLTPVAVLLKLTLTFPDRAPSRYRVARRSGNIAELQKSLEKARRRNDKESLDEIAEAILALATALSTHDRQTRGHSERVRVFTDMLAEELKVPVAERNRLRWAALLHDIGKLDVPAKILNKPGALDDDEWAVIKQHPRAGLRFIGVLGTWLGPHATTILHHHERYDGKGYPEGVGGEQISLGARIVSVADSFDTMTAARPYKKPLSAAAARQELSRCAGGQFDPVVVRAMMNIALGRLWWRVGIASWLAQLPFVGPASQVIGRALETSIGAARTAAAAASIALAGVTAPLVGYTAQGDHEGVPSVVAQDAGASMATDAVAGPTHSGGGHQAGASGKSESGEDSSGSEEAPGGSVGGSGGLEGTQQEGEANASAGDPKGSEPPAATDPPGGQEPPSQGGDQPGGGDPGATDPGGGDPGGGDPGGGDPGGGDPGGGDPGGGDPGGGGGGGGLLPPLPDLPPPLDDLPDLP